MSIYKLRIFQFAAILIVFLVSAFLLQSLTVHAAGYKHSFEADLSGDQEVPPVSSASTTMSGSAKFNVSMDEREIDYTVSVSGGSATGKGLYCARAGSNGPLILSLSSSGTIVEADISSGAAVCNPNIRTTSHLVQAMREGSVYVNILTEAYPEGEIRGQLDEVPVEESEEEVNTAPTITLNGSSSLALILGSMYNELGATAFDAEDGDITSGISLSGSVNTAATGTYSIAYNVTDTGGLSATTTRSILVFESESPTATTTPPTATSTPSTETSSDDDNSSRRRSGGRRNVSSNSSEGQGEVLGVSTSNVGSCSYLTGYIKFGAQNDVYNVALLQIFLNKFTKTNLSLTGIYDSATHEALKAFQLAHKSDVLDPWKPFGLADNTATGYVYKTTKYKIDTLSCGINSVAAPILP